MKNSDPFLNLVFTIGRGHKERIDLWELFVLFALYVADEDPDLASLALMKAETLIHKKLAA